MARPAPTIIPGTRYGRLVTTGSYIPGHYDGNKRISAKVECKCACGSISYKELGQIKKYNKNSCSKKCPYFINVIHGLSVDENSKPIKEYKAWTNMKRYCDNPNSIGYQYNGEKGITYHESLSTIEGFMEVMGAAPSKYHRFTRIDKDGDYEPGNVYWYLADGKYK